MEPTVAKPYEVTDNIIQNVTMESPPPGDYLGTPNVRQTDTTLNILVGIIGAGFLIILLIFTKSLQWYRKLKELIEGNRTRSEDENNDACTRGEETVIQVEYTLHDDPSNLNTVSGIVSAFVRGKFTANNRIELRTASSYRDSFRNFKKTTSAKNDVLPSYDDVTKSHVDSELPQYGNLPESSDVSSAKDA